MSLTINHVITFNLPSDVQEKFVALLNQLLQGQGKIMSTLQDLSDKFDAYIAKRDEIDAAKDAASAAKDATIKDLTDQLAAAAAAAGVPQAQLDTLQAGIDAAVAKEQAALDALTPPAPPVVEPTPVANP